MNLKKLPSAFTERYTLQERVGAGGMGELYLARDKKLNKPVAVKFILGDEDELSRRRFFREAKIQMRLEHEGIADLIDFAKEPLPYIAFEYVQGMTLWQYASQKGILPTDEAVEKILQICKSMAYAHRHGILHRDLKTENVMLNEDGKTKIIDFGLARRSDITSTITKTGVILGTPAYMAPELVKGEKASKQADVYAAGVIFYELLTGQQPFVADTPLAVMMKCLKKEVPDPRQLNPDLDDELTKIVLRALAKESIDRYISFDEMVNDLERWRKGEQKGGRKGVVWCLGSEGVHRISVKDGQVTGKEKFPIKGQSYTIAGGIIALEDNVYFAAHRTPKKMQLGTSFAPGAFDGRFELFELNWKKQSITSFQPPITVESVVATDGAFRTFAYINSSFLGFSAYHINSFSFVGNTLKSRRSFGFENLVRKQVLSGWAINRDGVIATVVPEGQIHVLPHQLVLYN